MIKTINDLIKDDLYLEIISVGKLYPEELPICYSLFSQKNLPLEYRKIRATFFESIFKYQEHFSIELLSKHLGISEDGAVKLKSMINSRKTVYFPIADNNDSKLAELNIIFTDGSLPLTFPSETDDFKKALETVYNATKIPFFAYTSDIFTDDSFTLALAAGLIARDVNLDKYCFTGSVRSSGEVEEVDFIEQKSRIKEKKLITYNIIKKIEDLNYFNEEIIDIPFVQLFGKPETYLENNLNYLKSQCKYWEIFSYINGISDNDISLYSQNNITFNQNGLLDVKNYFNKFISVMMKIYRSGVNVRLNLIGSLASFALGIGIILGAKKSFRIYHFQDGKYFLAIDMSDNGRKIKEKKSEYKYITKKESETSSDELTIILYLASHNPKGYDKDFKTNKIYIELKEFQGNIPPSPDIWMEIVSEIYSAIDNFSSANNISIKTYNFILSVPVPIAFALGMAIGDYKQIRIFQYDKESQRYVCISDNYLRNFF